MTLAACGGGSGGGAAGPQESAGTPKVGGTLTFGEVSPPAGMDPIVETGSGSTGLIELTAVYDTLMRYNFQTGRYDPGTALSATPNADDTVWTIKLRPGITFTDGTDYDADAVVFGLNRFRTGGPGGPTCAEVFACPAPATVNIRPFVKDITALDKTTVQVTMADPWGSFPVVLAAEPGLIPSPTALKKCDAAKPANQCGFNTAPVGAGPFMVTSFKPGEAITMARNPHYWGGPAYLDGLRFVTFGDGGSSKTLDALQAGQVQAADLLQPKAAADAKAAKLGGFPVEAFVTPALLFNVGVSPAPTNSLAVRRAIAAAVDPNVISQRAFDGQLQATTELLPSNFRWSPGVPGPTYDPAEARQLVDQAKAAGWDGRVRVLGSTSPSLGNIALAVQAMLQSVGVTVVVDNSKDIAAALTDYVNGDYDIAPFGPSATNDDWSLMSLAAPLMSTSPSNRLGVKDDALDAAFKQLFAARTDPEKTAAWRAVATEIGKQVPLLPLGVQGGMLAWTDKVHGVQQQVRASVYLDKAWIG